MFVGISYEQKEMKKKTKNKYKTKNQSTLTQVSFKTQQHVSKPGISGCFCIYADKWENGILLLLSMCAELTTKPATENRLKTNGFWFHSVLSL